MHGEIETDRFCHPPGIVQLLPGQLRQGRDAEGRRIGIARAVVVGDQTCQIVDPGDEFLALQLDEPALDPQPRDVIAYLGVDATEHLDAPADLHHVVDGHRVTNLQDREVHRGDTESLPIAGKGVQRLIRLGKQLIGLHDRMAFPLQEDRHRGHRGGHHDDGHPGLLGDLVG